TRGGRSVRSGGRGARDEPARRLSGCGGKRRKGVALRWRDRATARDLRQANAGTGGPGRCGYRGGGAQRARRCALRQAGAPPAGSRFGTAVAVIGNTVAIGAPFAEVGGASCLLGGDTGRLLATLNDPTPHPGDQFGYAIAATTAQVFVGAPLDDVGSTDAG